MEIHICTKTLLGCSVQALADILILTMSAGGQVGFWGEMAHVWSSYPCFGERWFLDVVNTTRPRVVLQLGNFGSFSSILKEKSLKTKHWSEHDLSNGLLGWECVWEYSQVLPSSFPEINALFE